VATRIDGPIPTVSVVVAVYNVGPYLTPCLQSLAKQTLSGLEIILVDDGSTDGSEDVCDAFAADRDQVTVIHVENGGLGKARNIGTERATGEFLAFADSDDIVPTDAYERMYHTTLSTGSDIVTGNVLRWTGTSLAQSGLHRRVFQRTVTATTVRRTPQLLYDTTAWNKIYRRQFWRDNDFRFPEGVLYEDIPVTIPAFCLAKSVDVLAEPVYWWRERQDGSLSITQRRTELINMRDRMSAVNSVNTFLSELGDEELKARHDQKVLHLDIRLFMRDLPDADETFRAEFQRLAGGFVRTTRVQVLDRLEPWERLKYYLLREGMMDELVEVIIAQRDGGPMPVRRRGFKLLADVPMTGRGRIASAVLNVSRVMPIIQGVGSVTWHGHELVVRGHAYIQGLATRTPMSVARRVVLREIGGEKRKISTLLRPARDPKVTADAKGMVPEDWAGFRVSFDARKLLPRGGDETTWQARVQVVSPWAMNSSRLGLPRNGAGQFASRQSVDGFLVVPSFHQDRWLVLHARPEVAVARTVTAEADALRLQGDLRGGREAWEGATLLLRVHEADAHTLSITLGSTADGRTPFVAELPIKELSAGHPAVAAAVWGVRIVTRSGDEVPVLAAPDLKRLSSAGQGREILTRASARGDLILIDQPPKVTVTGLEWDASGRLHIRAHSAAGDGAGRQFALVHTRGARVDGTVVSTQGSDVEIVFDVQQVPGPIAARPVAAGTWRAVVVAPEDNGVLVDQPLRVDTDAAAAIESQQLTEPVICRPLVTGTENLSLHVLALDDDERGPRHQLDLQRGHYRLQRLRKRSDGVLFESWRGKQYSDSPRAISEELSRRGGPDQLWVVNDRSVQMPDDIPTVVRLSRDYYSALARARWVVANDSMPTFYSKRAGTTYLQTWHGTPLKRIGFDMDTIHFANKNYLEEFRHEVAKWDFLVSPNSFSTEILRRAFRYDGEILETGYPRNDVFHAGEQEAIRERVRTWYGIPRDKRVVLWAPTWRDNAFTPGRRYVFPMTLDLARVADAVGGDTVLLFRGHHLVSATIDQAALSNDFVKDVTQYPDVSDLYLAADVLMTDYSSVMFDFANTGKPMLFYTWDLEMYRDVLRGFYFDFEKDAPGPLLRTTDEVIAALRDLEDVAASFSGPHAAFVERFCSLDDGRAAARVVDRVFG
jgi:CDP-glycerol glycerophosphotransferase